MPPNKRYVGAQFIARIEMKGIPLQLHRDWVYVGAATRRECNRGVREMAIRGQ